MLPASLGIEPHRQVDHRHVAERGQDAGDEGGGEHLGDVLLGQDGVDHQHDRRRDQDAQRAAGGQGTAGQAVGITGALEFGQRNLAHRCRGGHRRAADRTEAGTGADGGHADAALAVAEEGLGGLEQRLRHAAQRRELPHQQEQAARRTATHWRNCRRPSSSSDSAAVGRCHRPATSRSDPAPASTGRSARAGRSTRAAPGTTRRQVAASPSMLACREVEAWRWRDQPQVFENAPGIDGNADRGRHQRGRIAPPHRHLQDEGDLGIAAVIMAWPVPCARPAAPRPPASAGPLRFPVRASMAPGRRSRADRPWRGRA